MKIHRVCDFLSDFFVKDFNKLLIFSYILLFKYVNSKDVPNLEKYASAAFYLMETEL